MEGGFRSRAKFKIYSGPETRRVCGTDPAAGEVPVEDMLWILPGWARDVVRKLQTSLLSSYADLPVDGFEVLERLSEVEISTWNYKAQDASIQHMGPMAQDFYAAFELGEDDKHIGTVDADGVSLAAIKALHQKLKEKDTQIADLEKRIAQLEALMLRSANR